MALHKQRVARVHVVPLEAREAPVVEGAVRGVLTEGEIVVSGVAEEIAVVGLLLLFVFVLVIYFIGFLFVGYRGGRGGSEWRGDGDRPREGHGGWGGDDDRGSGADGERVERGDGDRQRGGRGGRYGRGRGEGGRGRGEGHGRGRRGSRGDRGGRPLALQCDFYSTDSEFFL